MSQKGFALILILVGVLIVAVVAGGAYYYVSSKLVYFGKSQALKPQVQDSVVAPQASQPTATEQPTPTLDETANWKTYSNKSMGISFKYPTTLTLEERQSNYLVLLSDANNPQSVLVSIDVRQSGNYADYDKAITTTKAGLTNIQTEEMMNGIKISGKIGPGFGEGQQVIIALFKYGTSAIGVETNVTDQSQLQIFNQILSTFKFN